MFLDSIPAIIQNKLEQKASKITSQIQPVIKEEPSEADLGPVKVQIQKLLLNMQTNIYEIAFTQCLKIDREGCISK